jgi:5-methylcytosine-specific restriction endonuclease McrA
MQPHTIVYLEYFGYSTADFIACECCAAKAIDLHHIIPRSKFGKKTKHLQDKIDNIIALCRKCHEDAHAEKLSKEYLQEIHNKNLR